MNLWVNRRHLFFTINVCMILTSKSKVIGSACSVKSSLLLRLSTSLTLQSLNDTPNTNNILLMISFVKSTLYLRIWDREVSMICKNENLKGLPLMFLTREINVTRRHYCKYEDRTQNCKKKHTQTKFRICKEKEHKKVWWFVLLLPVSPFL